VFIDYLFTIRQYSKLEGYILLDNEKRSSGGKPKRGKARAQKKTAVSYKRTQRTYADKKGTIRTLYKKGDKFYVKRKDKQGNFRYVSVRV
jgi:hypothetical protein